jgi:hypothetical protein
MKDGGGRGHLPAAEGVPAATEDCQDVEVCTPDGLSRFCSRLVALQHASF